MVMYVVCICDRILQCFNVEVIVKCWCTVYILWIMIVDYILSKSSSSIQTDMLQE